MSRPSPVARLVVAIRALHGGRLALLWGAAGLAIVGLIWLDSRARDELSAIGDLRSVAMNGAIRFADDSAFAAAHVKLLNTLSGSHESVERRRLVIVSGGVAIVLLIGAVTWVWLGREARLVT